MMSPAEAVILAMVAGLILGLWVGYGVGHWHAESATHLAADLAYARGRQDGYCAAKQEELNATMLKVRLADSELTSVVGRN